MKMNADSVGARAIKAILVVAFILASGLIGPVSLVIAANEAAPPQPSRPAIVDQKLTGYLGARYRLNIAYVHRLYDREAAKMLAPFQKRGSKNDWSGEYAGKWLDAASFIAVDSGDQELRRKVDTFASQLRATQEKDGYLGIDSPDKRMQPWDIWNQWNVNIGLVTHYEKTKDHASLEAAKKQAHWIVAAYGVPDSPKHRFFAGSWEGGCNVDFIDQLVRLHAASPDPELLAFARGIVANFRDIGAMRTTKKATLTHSYVLCAYLGGIVQLAQAAKPEDTTDLAWVKTVWEDIRQNHVYPTGSISHKECLKATAPSDEPDANHQETCSTVEWLRLNHRLYRATDDVRYVEQIENSLYNALPAAQSRDGQEWCYYLPLRYQKKFGIGPTMCCYWSGPRGMARLPSYIYSSEPGGVRVDFFEASEATALIDGQKVSLRQRTTFPADGKTVIEVSPEKPADFALAIRAPKWAQPLIVEVNGETLGNKPDADGYYRIRRRWSESDTVSIRFSMPVSLRPLRTAGLAVVRGPEVLALDARDNPNLNLDAVSLPAKVVLSPAPSDQARRRYRATVILDGSPRDVTFTPYADAGNDKARYRTIFPAARQNAT